MRYEIAGETHHDIDLKSIDEHNEIGEEQDQQRQKDFGNGGMRISQAISWSLALEIPIHIRNFVLILVFVCKVL